jgi:hypothetical protein
VAFAVYSGIMQYLESTNTLNNAPNGAGG